MLPVYFESFIPEYGDYRHNLRNDQIRLPLIRCEYGCESGLGSSTVDQVLKYTKYPKYIPSTSTGQVLIF